MPKLIFNLPDGSTKEVEGTAGATVQSIARDNDIPLESACEGALACSTCHVVVDSKWFDKTGEVSEDEEDMLDLAFDLQETSRLSCQITMTDELDGIELTISKNNRNL